MQDIRVFGKPKCKKCEAAKMKLEVNFKLPYTFINMEDLDAMLAIPRVLAADAQSIYEDTATLPVIGIGGKAYEYAEAMGELKRRLRACQKKT